MLILWLDCDREGEAIAFDVMYLCLQKIQNLSIYRSFFSAITKRDIENAMLNLGQPDKNQADAVEARQEIDLRIGAAFTRFQTLMIQRYF